MSRIKSLLNNKKVLQVALAVVLVGLFLFNQRFQETAPVTGQNTSQLHHAIARKQSNVQVSGDATVIKLLADDNSGSRHQRILIRLSSGEVILIAHNIDLAPKIASLQKGDQLGFNGEFEWNDKGGVIHWTHRDPRRQHQDGYLLHDGEKYW